MTTWLNKSPANVPSVSDQTKVNYIEIRQDKNNASKLLVAATYKEASQWSSFIGYSQNYGDTWSWEQISTGGGGGTEVLNYYGWYALEDASAISLMETDGLIHANGKPVANMSDTKLVVMGIDQDFSSEGRFVAWVVDRSGTSLTHNAYIPYGGCISNQGWSIEKLNDQMFAQLTFYRAADESVRTPKFSVGLITGGSIDWGNEIRTEEVGWYVTTGFGMGVIDTSSILVVRSDNDYLKTYIRKVTVGPSTSVSQGVQYDIASHDHYGFGVATHNITTLFIAGTSRVGVGTTKGLYWLVNIAGASLQTLDSGIFDETTTRYVTAKMLTADTGILGYGNGTSGEVRVYKISGGSVTFGSPSTSGVWDEYLRLDKLDASTVLMAYNDSAGSGVRTHWNVVLQIDGTSINSGPITHTSSLQPYNSVQGVFNSTTAYCGFQDWEDVVNPSVFDPGGAFLIDLGGGTTTVAKALSAEISSGGASGYVTLTDGSNIILNAYSLPDLTRQISTTIGAGTTEETDAKTYWAGVRTYHQFTNRQLDKHIWLFGRMSSVPGQGADSHLVRSTDGGTTFTLISNEFGTNYVAALDVEWSGTVNAIVPINNIGVTYRGSTAIYPISYLPFIVDHRGFHHSEDNYLIAGGSLATEIKIAYTTPGAGLWYDLTKNHTTTPTITGIGLV